MFSLGEELVEIINRHHVFFWECFTEGFLAGLPPDQAMWMRVWHD